MSDDKLLTKDEAGTILRASACKLQALREKGNGPPFLRLGRNVLYPASQVVEWLRATLRSKTTGGSNGTDR
jgi:hypothetical protein